MKQVPSGTTAATRYRARAAGADERAPHQGGEQQNHEHDKRTLRSFY